jgi:hypothetical protein
VERERIEQVAEAMRAELDDHEAKFWAERVPESRSTDFDHSSAPPNEAELACLENDLR